MLKTPGRLPSHLFARLLDRETRERWFDPALADLVQDHVRAGARRGRAWRRLGGLAFHVRVLLLVIECARLKVAASRQHRSRGDGPLARWWHDLRYAARGLRKTPGFTLVAVLVFGLGVGANTALFSVLDGVVLRPLPFRDPGRLVAIWETDRSDNNQAWRVAPANFVDWREQAGIFDGVAAFGAFSTTLTGQGEATQLLGGAVTANYFDVLGVRPVSGRTFQDADETAGAPVAILGYALWQSRFGGRSDVLGRGVTLDGSSYTVVGIMPPGIYPSWPVNGPRMHFLPRYQDVWVLQPQSRFTSRRSHVFGVVARLKPGLTMADAQTRMDLVAAGLAQQYADDRDAGVLVRPLADEVVGSARTPLLLLFGAVIAVLLVACSNVASLLLARLTTRRQEIAVRAALGAGRAALVRRFLAEGAVLALAGGLVGIGLAAVLREALLRFVPPDLPRLGDSSIDGRVLLFALGVSVVAALVFALAPGWSAGRSTVSDILRASRGTESGRPQRLRNVLVVAEVALAVVLTTVAGLLGQSFWHLSRADPGFRTDHLLVASLVLPPSRYTSWQQIRGFYDDLLDRARALPGVESADIAYDHPLDTNWLTGFSIEGDTGREPPAVQLRIVSPGYFSALGLRVVEGREFRPSDDERHAGAVVVNEAFARRYFPDGRALGRVVVSSAASSNWNGAMPGRFDVVGVVADVRRPELDSQAEPFLYMTSRQFPRWEMKLLVRTAGDPLAHLPDLHRAVATLDPDLPLSDVTTMAVIVDDAVAQPRLSMLLMSIFGAIALVLSLMGIYGLMAFWVAARTRELGLRLALGARPGDVVRLVLGRGALLVGLGAAAGGVTALGLSSVLRSQLYGVSPADPFTLSLVPLAMLTIALVACLVPARRAARVDPVIALRAE